MGNIHTQIVINSSDTVPGNLSIVSEVDTQTGVFAQYGTRLATTALTYESIIGLDACGPKGALVYIKADPANEAALSICGSQQILEELNEGDTNLNGLAPFATLHPGESLVVPLSSYQTQVAILAAYGTGKYTYYISDKGGTFGNSAIRWFTIDNKWQYFVTDAEVSGILPNITNLQNTDISSVVYYLSNSWIIQDAAYIFEFVNNGDYNDRQYVYIDKRGNFTVINVTDPDTQNIYYSQAKVLTLKWLADSIYHVVTFDESGVYTYPTFTADNATLIDDYYSNNEGFNFSCASDNTVILKIQNYNSDSTTYYFLLNKGNLIKTAQYSGDPYIRVDSAAVYMYANFIFIPWYNNDSRYYDHFEIWSTNGTKLHTVDVSAYNTDTLDYRFFGTNKLYACFNSSAANLDYNIVYNGNTNKLIGVNDSGTIIWTHTTTGNFNNKRVFAYDKWIIDSIRNNNYTWNKGMYNPEAIVVVYFGGSNDNDYFINWNTSNCDIEYVLDGDSNFTVYQFANGSPRAIRLPYEYGFSKVYPSDTSIIFSTAPTTEVLAITALIINKDGVHEGESIIPDTTNIDLAYNGINFKPVGNYVMWNWYDDYNNITTYKMLKNPTTPGNSTTDTVNIAGDQRYPGVWRSRFNSLLLRSWNYNYPRNWYYDVDMNIFVELTTGGDTFDVNKPFYPRQIQNQSATKTGVNDGNLLLCPNGSINGPYNNNLRVLSNGRVSKNITLPDTSDYFLGLINNAVVFGWPDPDNSYNGTVKLYDLNLNLLKTVYLTDSSTDNWYLVGNRVYIVTHDNSETVLNTWMISTDTTVLFAGSYNNAETLVVNDYYSWY